jgi:hypothetical protein
MSDSHDKIVHLYLTYNTVIKPLIAEVEARMEQFPLPLFNEIRALHDHISRCYQTDIHQEQIDEEIAKAYRHVTRITLDCYKYLNLTMHEIVLKFNHETRNIDLTVLNDGTFYPTYKSKFNQAVSLVRQAKMKESVDTNSALDIYQQAYNVYSELEALLESETTDIHWAKVRFRSRFSFSVILWILSAVASGLVSVLIAKWI